MTITAAENAIRELQRSGVTFDPTIGQYRDDATGRPVSDQRVLDTIESFMDYIARNMTTVTERYLSEILTLIGWQEAMRDEVKDSLLIGAIIGVGGLEFMRQRDWMRLNRQIRQQYGYLDNLAWERFNEQVTDDRMVQRAGMYANAGRMGYYEARTDSLVAYGFSEERRVLNPAEHCFDCIAYAALGWQPIGTLPEPGDQSECLTNCRCNKEYRAQVDIEERLAV
jgi:hypothetical protein